MPRYSRTPNFLIALHSLRGNDGKWGGCTLKIPPSIDKLQRCFHYKDLRRRAIDSKLYLARGGRGRRAAISIDSGFLFPAGNEGLCH